MSWDLKKPDREKDLQDLNLILNYYWDFVDEEAYRKHLDLFDDQFETHLASARILGRNLQKTLDKSDILKENILRILYEQSKIENRPSLMLIKLAFFSKKHINEVKRILDEIIKGINDII